MYMGLTILQFVIHVQIILIILFLSQMVSTSLKKITMRPFPFLFLLISMSNHKKH